MRQQVLEAYEQGYLDGLRKAHAELLNGARLGERVPDAGTQTETHHPLYHEGFSEGLRDGTEVLIALGKTPQTRQI